MKPDVTVDATYQSCPGPLLALADAVSRARPGQVIKLRATDPAAPSDVREWSAGTGHKLLEIIREGDVYEIYIGVSG
jgi:tRNA 2-thiouridine synthesizing protein A